MQQLIQHMGQEVSKWEKLWLTLGCVMKLAKTCGTVDVMYDYDSKPPKPFTCRSWFKLKMKWVYELKKCS